MRLQTCTKIDYLLVITFKTKTNQINSNPPHKFKTLPNVIIFDFCRGRRLYRSEVEAFSFSPCPVAATNSSIGNATANAKKTIARRQQEVTELFLFIL